MQGLGLVFVAVYQRALKLLYVDALLERLKAEFAEQVSAIAHVSGVKHRCRMACMQSSWTWIPSDLWGVDSTHIAVNALMPFAH